MKFAPLTPEQMVAVRAFAPFEMVEVFVLWGEMMEQELQGLDVFEQIPTPAKVCGGLGPPSPMLDETLQAFGLRCATALFHLIKKV